MKNKSDPDEFSMDQDCLIQDTARGDSSGQVLSPWDSSILGVDPDWDDADDDLPDDDDDDLSSDDDDDLDDDPDLDD